MNIEEKQAQKIAEAGLITIDLEDFYPKGERFNFDLKDFLFEGLILKEKDFRKNLEGTDWANFEGKHVALHCSNEAIIPAWAYMLVTSKLEPHAETIVQGNLNALDTVLFEGTLAKMDVEKYRDKKIMVKGCGDKLVPASAYAELTRRLRPVVRSLMYGEPCSAVPVYKNKKR